MQTLTNLLFFLCSLMMAPKDSGENFNGWCGWVFYFANRRGFLVCFFSIFFLYKWILWVERQRFVRSILRWSIRKRCCPFGCMRRTDFVLKLNIILQPFPTECVYPPTIVNSFWWGLAGCLLFCILPWITILIKLTPWNSFQFYCSYYLKANLAFVG